MLKHFSLLMFHMKFLKSNSKIKLKIKPNKNDFVFKITTLSTQDEAESTLEINNGSSTSPTTLPPTTTTEMMIAADSSSELI